MSLQQMPPQNLRTLLVDNELDIYIDKYSSTPQAANTILASLPAHDAVSFAQMMRVEVEEIAYLVRLASNVDVYKSFSYRNAQNAAISSIKLMKIVGGGSNQLEVVADYLVSDSLDSAEYNLWEHMNTTQTVYVLLFMRNGPYASRDIEVRTECLALGAHVRGPFNAIVATQDAAIVALRAAADATRVAAEAATAESARMAAIAESARLAAEAVAANEAAVAETCLIELAASTKPAVSFVEKTEQVLQDIVDDITPVVASIVEEIFPISKPLIEAMTAVAARAPPHKPRKYTRGLISLN